MDASLPHRNIPMHAEAENRCHRTRRAVCACSQVFQNVLLAIRVPKHIARMFTNVAFVLCLSQPHSSDQLLVGRDRAS